jgi:hypothetical protein
VPAPLRIAARSDAELEPVAVGVEDDALVAPQLAGAVRRLEYAVAGCAKYPTQLVDGVGGSEREADVPKPRRPPICRRVAAVDLDDLQADAAEIEDAARKMVAGVRRKRQGHPSEPAVEVTQGLELARGQRDVLDLGDPPTEGAAHKCSSTAARIPGSRRADDWPWYMATPFRPGSRLTTAATSGMPGEETREISTELLDARVAAERPE